MKPGKNEQLVYEDNGFSSAKAMTTLHRAMLDAGVSLLRGQTGNILDLGCGNGSLVTAIASRLPGVVPFGVECLPDRAQRGRTRLELADGHLYIGDIFSAEQPWFDSDPYLLTLLMIGRLLEASEARRSALIRTLEHHTILLLLYTYGDPLSMSRACTQLLANAFPRAVCMAGLGDGSLPRIWVHKTEVSASLPGAKGNRK
jgi:hypothetical protein